MAELFDAAVFRAAVQAAIVAPPKPTTLPGIGRAFRRDLTVSDVHEAAEIVQELAKTMTLSEKRIGVGVGLAQTLCGPDGVLVFDPRNPDDVTLLATLPWTAARGIAQGDQPGEEKND